MITLLLLLGLFAPVVFLAARRETELDRLFARLRASADLTAARAITDQIWDVWLRHDDAEVRSLMERGIRAMESKTYDPALTCFETVTRRAPGYPEGWNKCATVRYLKGDYAGSVRAIKQTLALEPRHFGALAGLGAIYLLIANDRGALDAFEAVLALNPHLDSIRRQVETLRGELDEED